MMRGGIFIEEGKNFEPRERERKKIGEWKMRSQTLPHIFEYFGLCYSTGSRT